MADILIGRVTYVVTCPQHGVVLESAGVADVNTACIDHWNTHHRSPARVEAGDPGGLAASAELRITTVTVTVPADIPKPPPPIESKPAPPDTRQSPRRRA